MLGPALGIAAYNVLRFGSPLEFGYGLITSRDGESVLSEPWYTHGIMSPLYIPRGLYAMLGRQWEFVEEFPWLHPTWAGQAVTFTMPILGWLIRAPLREPLAAYALGSAGLIVLVELMHGETGYAQFGYRFIVGADSAGERSLPGSRGSRCSRTASRRSTGSTSSVRDRVSGPRRRGAPRFLARRRESPVSSALLRPVAARQARTANEAAVG